MKTKLKQLTSLMRLSMIILISTLSLNLISIVSASTTYTDIYSKEQLSHVLSQAPDIPIRISLSLNATPTLKPLLEKCIFNYFNNFNVRFVQPDENPFYTLSILGTERGRTGAISYNLFRHRDLSIVEGYLKATENKALAEWLSIQRLGNNTQNKLHLTRISELDVQQSVKEAMEDYLINEMFPWIESNREL